jgi:putative flippase GtrA
MAKVLVVGGTSWCIDTGIFTVLSHTVLDNKVITAKIISILVSTIFSYIANREWSFNRRGGRERHHEAMLFFVVNALALGLNLIPLAVSRYLLGFTTEHYSQVTVTIVDFVAANVIGTLIAMAFRFWAYRRFVFPDELEEYDELDDPDSSGDAPRPDAGVPRTGPSVAARIEPLTTPLPTAVSTVPPVGLGTGPSPLPTPRSAPRTGPLVNPLSTVREPLPPTSGS